MENRDFGVSTYQAGRVTTRPGIAVAYPVMDSGGGLRGVVFAALDTEEFGHIGKDAWESLPKGAVLTKIDTSGTVLGRSPKDDRVVGKAYPDMDAVRPLLAKDGGLAAGNDGAGALHIFSAAKVPDPLFARDVFVVVSFPESAAGLTRQLLAFSRKQVFELKVVDLNDVLAHARKMYQRLIGEDIELALNLSVDIGRVKIDPGQFEQVVMNLVVNSRDAMPQGGKLVIETQRADLSEPQAFMDGMVTMPAGSYVQVNVTDTGCGMDEQTLRRIFDPFFTTKEAGKGTGLGLSTSYGIVKQSGGYIWASSKPGKGTTFSIFLPEVEETADGAAERPAASPIPRGSETILVVEDDASMRNLVRDFLEDCGYRVHTAGSPLEALRIAGANNGAIDLLLTDVIMPGESGVVLAERFTRAWPKEKVLFISGYPADAITVHGVLKEGVYFLPKPFTKEVLAKKMREVLDS